MNDLFRELKTLNNVNILHFISFFLKTFCFSPVYIISLFLVDERDRGGAGMRELRPRRNPQYNFIIIIFFLHESNWIMLAWRVKYVRTHWEYWILIIHIRRLHIAGLFYLRFSHFEIFCQGSRAKFLSHVNQNQSRSPVLNYSLSDVGKLWNYRSEISNLNY